MIHQKKMLPYMFVVKKFLWHAHNVIYRNYRKLRNSLVFFSHFMLSILWIPIHPLFCMILYNIKYTLSNVTNYSHIAQLLRKKICSHCKSEKKKTVKLLNCMSFGLFKRIYAGLILKIALKGNLNLKIAVMKCEPIFLN